MAEAGASKKAVYLGGQTLDNVSQGNLVGSAGIDQAFVSTLLKGKVSAGDLATDEADALKRMYRVARSGAPANLTPDQQVDFNTKVAAMKQAAFDALTNPSLKGSVRDNAKVELVKMLRNLGGDVRDSDGNVVTDLGTRDF